MRKSDIAQIRLSNQQIIATKFTKPEEIVSWFGAMQAQDYPMAKWAIGLRLPGSTEQTIETAVEKGSILRTHILRPTWHFVAAEDLRWMLALTRDAYQVGIGRDVSRARARPKSVSKKQPRDRKGA